MAASPRLTGVRLSAMMAVLGALLGESMPVAPLLSTTILATAVAGVVATAGSRRRRKVALLLSLLMLTAVRAQWLRSEYRRCDVTSGHTIDDHVVLTGRVASVPVLSVRPTSRFSPSAFGNPATTRFLLDVSSVVFDGQTRSASGRCSVYVDGNVVSQLRGGDAVRLSGELSWPQPPRNPGEFDFAAHLRRQQISGLVFAKHPDAVVVVERAAFWRPLRLASTLRQQFRHVITSSVPPELSAVALALLLGNRHQLTETTRDAFVASGAMHLLAISGLHVGILFGVLVRVGNWLFASRRVTLLAAVLICLMYALVTDLRPSVVRAAVFCCVFSCSQLLGRSTSLSDVIAVTALGMLLHQPAVVFSCGAWLSFLSVTALALSPWSIAAGRAAPPISLTVGDRLRASVRAGGGWITVRLGQMVMILIFTLPLAAFVFHAVAPIGFFVNLLLIACAGWGLGTGFFLLFAGGLCPPLSPLPGMLFGAVLQIMTAFVQWASEFSWGHFYVSDLSLWFPAVWYACLGVFVIRPHRTLRAVLVAIMLAALVAAGTRHMGRTWPIRCTVLSVGQGSCSVLEAGDGRVFVVDAGAMGRGPRVSRLLCDFLWQAGYRQVEGVVISHADTDHINGLAGLLRRLPVRQLFATKEVFASDRQAVRSLLQLAGHRQVSQVIVEDGDQVDVGQLNLQLFQAAAPQRISEDAASLVVVVSGRESRLLLPADLEGSGALDVYRRIGPVDVHVSAHHGAQSANDRRIAHVLQPDLVVVSARDFRQRTRLEQVYAASREVLFTASGAVSIALENERPRWTVFAGNHSTGAVRDEICGQSSVRQNSPIIGR